MGEGDQDYMERTEYERSFSSPLLESQFPPEDDEQTPANEGSFNYFFKPTLISDTVQTNCDFLIVEYCNKKKSVLTSFAQNVVFLTK